MPIEKTDNMSVTTQATEHFADIPSDLLDRLTSEADRRSVIQPDAPLATRFVHQVIMARRAQVFSDA